MPRRIDIELTSSLDDGSWTWRAAGARVPKGVLDGTILPDGAAVGDELKVEVEQGLDGIVILSVVKGREKQDRDLLEMLPVEESFDAVIQTRAARERGERGDRRDRGDRRGGRDGKRGGRRDGRRRDGDDRGQRRDGDGRGERRKRPHFEPPPEVPQRPKPKRLRPGRTHRNEVLAEIPEEQRPIAEVALQGMQAVRTRLKDENKRLAADGKPTMPEASVLKMAEELLPKLRVADWLDRAEAAQRQMQHLDLRDLRSVVAASDDPVIARDDSTRELAEQLKKDLARKQDEELKLWLEDVDAALSVGRSIRALRLSSQPPKAGVMFPPDLARRLGEAATAGLGPDDSPDRWAAVMEAAAFSPVRTLVVPTTPPNHVTDDLRKTALRLGPLLPQIAALLEVEVPEDAPRPKPLRPQPRKDAKRKKPAGQAGSPGGGPKPARNTTPPRGERTAETAKPKTAEPAPEPAPSADAPAASDEPAAEPAPEPAASDERAAEPSPEPAASDEPAAEPSPEPAASDEPAPEPADETAASDEPAAEPAPEPAASDEPAPEPSADEPAASDEPTPDTAAEPAPEPSADETAASDEPTPDTAAEPAPEPSADEKAAATDDDEAGGG